MRDTRGREVFGVPVQWSVRGGRLAVQPGQAEPGPLLGDDYAWVSAACQHPLRSWKGDRVATLRASYGDLSDSVQLRWSYPEGWKDRYDEAELEEYFADWAPDPYCTGAGCNGCASGGSGAGALGLLGLLAAALGLRRRGQNTRPAYRDRARLLGQ